MKDTYVLNVHGNSFVVFSNQEDLQRLGILWSIAARFKNAFIYLPTRKNPLTSYLKECWSQNGLDLLLLQHHVQFPLKRWKTIRSNLRRGKVVSVKSRIDQDLNLTFEDYCLLWDQYPHDRLDVKQRYETLFLVGSSRVFHYMVPGFFQLSRSGPRLSGSGYHDHIHLDSFLKGETTDEYSSLAVDFYDRKMWSK